MKRYDIKVLPTVVKAMIIENYVGNSFGKGHVRYSPNMVWKERERHASGIELPAPLDLIGRGLGSGGRLGGEGGIHPTGDDQTQEQQDQDRGRVASPGGECVHFGLSSVVAVT